MTGGPRRRASRLRLVLPASLTVLLLPVTHAAIGPPAPSPETGVPADVRQLLKDGRYAEAEALARRRLAEEESASGPESLPTGLVLDGLAEALWQQGKGADPEARDVGTRALAIKENLLGPEDLRLAASLRNLAILTNQNGDYTAAHRLFERAVGIDERVLGPGHPEVASMLDNLANVMRNEGDYTGALALTERAVGIKRRQTGGDTFSLATSVGNLAINYALMGDYDRARSLFEESLALFEKVLPPDHPKVLNGLDNLAELMMMAGDYPSARPLEERALRLREARLGPDDFHVALSLGNMGHLETLSGNRTPALKYLERALNLYERAFGPVHPWVARSLDDLGEARMEFDDPGGARDDFERALGIQEQALDARHPDRVRTVLDLAKAQLRLGEAEAAFDHGLEAERIGREHFQTAAQGLSQEDALRYLQVRGSGVDVALTLLATTPGGTSRPDAVARVWDQIIRSRAMVLDEMASRNRYLADPVQADVAQRARALLAARTRLARLMGGLPQSGDLEAYRKSLNDAYDAKEAAERDLAAASAPFRTQWSRSRMGLADVVKALPKQTALVAFAQYRPIGASSSKPVETSYVAFVLHAGAGNPVMIPLGEAREIDALVRTWQEHAGTDPRRAPSIDAAEDRYRAAGEKLRRRIWDPLARFLGKPAMLLVVPDGSLNLVSFATLPIPGGRYLLEDGPVVHYLSGERDIVPGASQQVTKPGLLALGAVDYDASPMGRGAVRAGGDGAGGLAAQRSRDVAHYRSPEAKCATMDSLRFAPLPATALEVDEVAARASRSVATAPGGGAGATGGAVVLKLVGAAADESTFKEQAGRYGILHLATHGFFANGQCAPEPGGGTDDATRPGTTPPRRPALHALQNPLLLSGLALSGANLHGGHRADGDAEDGLLTAEEIAALDLGGVRWAVLSACRTGVGAIQGGEGVLGLRRAFEIAGASTLIMSLWSVEDEAALAWMKNLYDARGRGLSSAASVRQASLDLLSAQRRLGRTTHPYFWGAFIAAGDWR